MMGPLGTRRKALHLAVAAVTAGTLAGCSVAPKVITPAEHQALVVADRALMFVEQEPRGERITLEEAIARALKYNLEARVQMMEQVVRAGQLDLSRYEMLPTLAANAGWVTRSNENLVVSENTVTGATSTDPTLSQDRQRSTANLTLTWNILDFGVSYLQARQNADNMLIAEQRRRRLLNQVMQQVRDAYWRAATAEPLAEEARPMLEQAHQALADARSTETLRLRSPVDSLNYQKGLLQVIRSLEQIQRDEAIAKAELASLMGLPPSTRMRLVLPPKESMRVPEVALGVAEMEELALQQRPELIEEAYQKRIAALEVRKALLGMLPGLTFNFGANYDSNSYNVNNDWLDAGARVSWNLFSIASGPQAIEVAEARESLADARRLALGMAVVTQVHVGYQEYLRRRHNFEQTRALDEIEQRLFGHAERAAEAQSESPLQLIRARLAALYSEVGMYQAYSDLQSATANLYLSVGMNPLPFDVSDRDLGTLTQAVAEGMAQWQ